MRFLLSFPGGSFFGRTVLLLSALALFLSGCASRSAVVKEESGPAVRQEAPARLPGAIWTGPNGKTMLFSDKKARYVNDIVTIIVEESSKADNSADTNTSRTTSSDAGINALLGLDQSILKRNANMGTSISIGGSSSSSLKGTGKTSRGGAMEATISAKVTEVLDNGNLVIEGRRQLTVNEEDQYIIITGIIRPEDITADNMIESQYIADARIVYTGDGVINDKMRPGWLTRIVDWVWPF
jgi:flagellar L-ring protein precursor FlgH